jgi:hypothetical protein
MRISTDGFIDVRDYRKIRTPGFHETKTDPMPEAEAVAFLLSHSFPGHRKIVRPMTSRERARLRVASWADSINERMSLLDKVWRGITKAVPSPLDPAHPELVQIVRVDAEWAYPIYLDGAETRVLPSGGVPISELEIQLGAPFLDVGGQKVSA